MLTLARPRNNDDKLLQEISAAKHNPTRQNITDVRQRVATACRRYRRSAPEVGQLPQEALSDAEKLALLHAYNVETKPFRRLRENLFTPAASARCPFCAISESDSLDHYLPKENYPEFAVFSKNLVPCCVKCNTRKRQLIVDEGTSARCFLHPYFDEVPNCQFLELDIVVRVRALVLTFRIVRTPALTQRTFDHLSNHFRVLDLGNRYRVCSLDELRGMRGALQRYFNLGGGQHVSTELNHRAASFEAEFGVNHWRSVLYASLSKHKAFCNNGFRLIPPA